MQVETRRCKGVWNEMKGVTTVRGTMWVGEWDGCRLGVVLLVD